MRRPTSRRTDRARHSQCAGPDEADQRYRQGSHAQHALPGRDSYAYVGACRENAVFALAGMADRAASDQTEHRHKPKLFITGSDAGMILSTMRSHGEIVPDLVAAGIGGHRGAAQEATAAPRGLGLADAARRSLTAVRAQTRSAPPCASGPAATGPG